MKHGICPSRLSLTHATVPLFVSASFLPRSIRALEEHTGADSPGALAAARVAKLSGVAAAPGAAAAGLRLSGRLSGAAGAAAVGEAPGGAAALRRAGLVAVRRPSLRP